MRKFLRITCYNHKYPFENVVGWTTELEDIIHCQLCRKVIYNPFLTSGASNTEVFTSSSDKIEER